MRYITKQPIEGLFDRDNLTIQFGGKHSKPENIFTCKCIKVPAYKYIVKERESLGNGWYGSVEKIEYIQDNLFVVIRDNICIGMIIPYYQPIKSKLLSLNNEAKSFLKKENIEWKEHKSL